MQAPEEGRIRLTITFDTSKQKRARAIIKIDLMKNLKGLTRESMKTRRITKKTRAKQQQHEENKSKTKAKKHKAQKNPHKKPQKSTNPKNPQKRGKMGRKTANHEENKGKT